ncbi:MAG: LysO family transporter [Bacteroidales bacterium]|nr:LysO family transporter [Bacteroidales bacterium]
MLIVIAVMAIGIVIGYFLRHKALLIKINNKFTMWAIYLLLFVLGVSIGANETIMKNLPILGLKALTITFGGVVGSIFLAWFTYTKFFKNKEQE